MEQQLLQQQAQLQQVQQPYPQQAMARDIDPLKFLGLVQDYDGRKEDLYPFLESIDNVISSMDEYSPTSQRMFLSIIKGKIKGKARTVLEIHPHLSRWIEIKNLLELNFGGLASTELLYEELKGAQYRGNVVQFYNYIQAKLSLLNQRHRLDGSQSEINHNNRVALKVFVNKLPLNLRTVLCALKPNSLEVALHELGQANLLSNEKPKNNNNSNNFKNQSYLQNSNSENKAKNHEGYSNNYNNSFVKTFKNPNPYNHSNPNPNFSHKASFNRNFYNQNRNRQNVTEPMDISEQTRQNYHINEQQPSTSQNFQFMASQAREPPNSNYPIFCLNRTNGQQEF